MTIAIRQSVGNSIPASQLILAGHLLYPPLDRLNPRHGVGVVYPALGLGEQTQSVLGRLAGGDAPGRVLPQIVEFLLGVFKRIAFVAQQVLNELAHLDILRAVLPCAALSPERVELLEGVLPEAQGRDRDIEHRRDLADFVVGFVRGGHGYFSLRIWNLEMIETNPVRSSAPKIPPNTS